MKTQTPLIAIGLIVLVFGTRCGKQPNVPPARTEAATPAPRIPGARFSKIGPNGTPRHGYYRIKTVIPKPWNYLTWEYQLNLDGSIYFIDRSTKRGVLLSPPFTIEEDYAAEGWGPK